jgi:TolA-binding protein
LLFPTVKEIAMKYAGVLLSALMLVVAVPASAEKGQGMMNMDKGQMQSGDRRSDMGMGGGMMDMPMMREHMEDMKEHMQQMMSADVDTETRMEQMQEHMQRMQRHMEMMQHMMEMMHGDGGNR